MNLLPDTKNCGLHKPRECRERFPRHRGSAIPTRVTPRAWRTCRDACRDRNLAVSFEVGVGENISGIPGACAFRNFVYPIRGPWRCGNDVQPNQCLFVRNGFKLLIVTIYKTMWESVKHYWWHFCSGRCFNHAYTMEICLDIMFCEKIGRHKEALG